MGGFGRGQTNSETRAIRSLYKILRNISRNKQDQPNKVFNNHGLLKSTNGSNVQKYESEMTNHFRRLAETNQLLIDSKFERGSFVKVWKTNAFSQRNLCSDNWNVKTNYSGLSTICLIDFNDWFLLLSEIKVLLLYILYYNILFDISGAEILKATLAIYFFW